MAVVSVITSIEQHFQITIEDDDINAETFTSLGSLTEFVASKLQTVPTANATWMD
jgi:acyl carrier protein